jgi:hypothetical protein
MSDLETGGWLPAPINVSGISQHLSFTASPITESVWSRMAGALFSVAHESRVSRFHENYFFLEITRHFSMILDTFLPSVKSRTSAYRRWRKQLKRREKRWQWQWRTQSAAKPEARTWSRPKRIWLLPSKSCDATTFGLAAAGRTQLKQLCSRSTMLNEPDVS